ncbi:immunoglobulin domain-containing protein beaten path VII [Haematobia irritans]|uniref:immunoglobulin domain-containing protein beaten path VII n=1 Tax=Haematobia irritans TaxID=7368 RepID=UPI003F501D6B
MVCLASDCLEKSHIHHEGHTEAEVQLIVPRYVERGTNATLECLHDVDPSVLFKVSWFREEMKFFEYVKGRKPPFKNFSMEGATIDRDNSNASQVTLTNVDFKLSGQFHCEVSMTSPLYTKASGEHLLSVFLPQTGPPVIRFRKRSPVAIGERLMVLCNTTRARPPPHITWLINNKKVDEKYIRTHHVFSISGKTHRPRPPPEQEFDILGAKQKKQQHQQQQQQKHHYESQPQQQPLYYQQQYSVYHPYPIPHINDRYDKSRWSGSMNIHVKVNPTIDSVSKVIVFCVENKRKSEKNNTPPLCIKKEEHEERNKVYFHVSTTAIKMDGHHNRGTSIYNNPFSALTIMHDIDIDDYEIQQQHHANSNFDNKHHIETTVKKHFDVKKHRGSRKYRRHINENALGIIRSTLNSGGFGPQPANINNELGIPPNAGPMNAFAASYGGRPLLHPGGGSGVAAAAAAVTEAQQEKGMFSVSQLNIELTEQHVGPNGKMELTCMATIPSAVGPGEDFADFKTYTIKVEVQRLETTTFSTTTQNIGMAALGNGASPSSAMSSHGSYRALSAISKVKNDVIQNIEYKNRLENRLNSTRFHTVETGSNISFHDSVKRQTYALYNIKITFSCGFE